LRFAKWRAVFKISSETPSELAIRENSCSLARYAVICQENGLVPIIEPEVLMDGDHTLETSIKITQKILSSVYKALLDANILLEGTILKPNMVLNGQNNEKSSSIEVGFATLSTLLCTVPAVVPTINFLSGGQSEEEASINLNSINSISIYKPWNLSFSFGRALQESCIKIWKGDKDNTIIAQKAFLERAKANSEASLGVYKGNIM
jgi:fructose-bisphosphate aldolase class I